MNKIIAFIKSLFQKKQQGEGKGWIKDPVDHRDVLLESIFDSSVEIPEEYKLPFKMDVKSQGGKPHCVGYSCATIKEFLEQKEGNNIEFDGDWIYKQCKKIDNYSGPGTYFRAGLKVLLNKGAMPVGGGDPAKYRIGGYTTVGTTFESIKEAIYRSGPVLVGFRGSNKGWKDEHIRPPVAGERVWGHAVALAVGYTKDRIYIQNSWGKGKGNDGYFYFDKNYLPMSAHCVLVDLPNNWQELLGKNKDKPKHQFIINLSKGITGEDVKVLQDCLKWLGCMDPKINCTGRFGPLTKQAVMAFQARYSIKPVAGFVGPITRSKLNELFN